MANALTAVAERPRWEIDHLLSGLIGRRVRLQARAFAPSSWDRNGHRELIPAGQLILPDGASTAGLPLLFEGRLLDYVRRIGVVHVRLDGLDSEDYGKEGVVNFRGAVATLLRGPALVELAYPFYAEAIPANASNYFADRKSGGCQLLLPLDESFLGLPPERPGTKWPGNPT